MPSSMPRIQTILQKSYSDIAKKNSQQGEATLRIFETCGPKYSFNNKKHAAKVKFPEYGLSCITFFPQLPAWERRVLRARFNRIA